ncbi:MAG: hypothetical protein LBB41_06865 [Prevotellaceae bacterium]|nr:hypothetical protein [Prevotellaceae bacterium]
MCVNGCGYRISVAERAIIMKIDFYGRMKMPETLHRAVTHNIIRSSVRMMVKRVH